MKKKKIIGLLFAFAAILTASFLVLDWMTFSAAELSSGALGRVPNIRMSLSLPRQPL